MFIVMITLAQAAEPPPFEVLDDIERWESGQDALILGPEGCWELEGKATQTLTVYQPPDFFAAARSEEFRFEGTFRGVLRDGSWSYIDQALKPTRELKWDLDGALGVTPLIGRMPDHDSHSEGTEISVSNDGAAISGAVAGGVNLLQEVIEALSGPAETSVAQWDRAAGAVNYLREVCMELSNKPIEVTTRFPAGGDKADRVDVIWPKLIKVGEWPLVAKIRDAQAHVVGHRQGDLTLPWAESISVNVGAWGFTLGWEQTLTYTRATQCSASTVMSKPKGEDSGGEDVSEGDE